MIDRIEPKPRMALRTIDAVRGLAALVVVLFHYGGVVLPTLAPHPLEGLLAFGEYGVEVFFVLSGFVIPYSMVRGGYGWSALGPFMWKRYLRIAPLAYFSALLMVGYHLLSQILLGRPVQSHDWPGIDAASVIGNLLFHPQLLGSSWFNFVFWTLAVELQFYFAIALMLPMLLQARLAAVNAAIMVALLGLSLIVNEGFILHCGYFILGVAAFLHRHGSIGVRAFLAVSITSMAALLLREQWAPVGLSMATTGLLLWRPGLGSRFTDWLGAISYCLYLMHVPVGYFCESALKRITGLHELAWGKILLLFVYTGIAVLAAHLLYHVAERPWLERLKRIRISGGPSRTSGMGTPGSNGSRR
ncbi:MAG: acyltransferase [Flavobacteriales bacterium]|nr:acyltransferase [Flavobacteriales bacterium]